MPGNSADSQRPHWRSAASQYPPYMVCLTSFLLRRSIALGYCVRVVLLKLIILFDRQLRIYVVPDNARTTGTGDMMKLEVRCRE
jgi:hypothetical protein